MKYTENYKLKKPEVTEFYNVEDSNDNADIVDRELKKIHENFTKSDDKLENQFITTTNFELLDTKKGGVEILNISGNGCAISKFKTNGKNFFDNTEVNVNQVGINVATHDAYLKLNGTKVAGKNVITIKNEDIMLPAGTYTISIKIVSGTIVAANNFDGIMCAINKSDYAQRTPGVFNVGESKSRSFTLDEDTLISTFDIIASYNGEGTVFTDVLIACQLERSDVATEFVPYEYSSATLSKQIGSNWIEELTTEDKIALCGLKSYEGVTYVLNNSVIRPTIEVKHGTTDVAALSIENANLRTILGLDVDKLNSDLNDLFITKTFSVPLTLTENKYCITDFPCEIAGYNAIGVIGYVSGTVTANVGTIRANGKRLNIYYYDSSATAGSTVNINVDVLYKKIL